MRVSWCSLVALSLFSGNFYKWFLGIYSKMDLLPYCRPRNLVSYEQFIDYLARQDLVLIGEDHSTERNERTILEDLISKEKRVCLVMEGPANNGCLPATKVVYVEPDNKDMIKVIKRIIPEHYLVFALVGSRHLNDGLIDNSLSISCPGIKSTTVFQDDFNTSLGIYELNTLKRKNYIIVGRL